MNGSKMVKLQLLLPFFCVLFIHCLAILLFTRGFLLTRTELPHFSNCSDVSHSPCFSSNATCWTQPSVDRIIILVFDALRFDFVAPSTFFEEKKPWMDKLDMFQKLAAEPGLSARIFKAIADPPTTSLQRLKGLTTGGLPTFIDVGNSFGAPAIVEDNLIRQLVRNGKRVVMMGDDTWLQLFPHHFEKSFPYPSFNVKDLDTVDNGCIQHLLPSLDEGNWDVLIAHFLGVDHAGHIFGVNTEPMMLKLKQYNSIVEKVVDALRNSSGPGGPHENTFLLVMGDHGQTLNGDHGGGSPEEVETSVFAMSFKNFSFSLPSELDTTSCGLNMDGRRICISTVEQIDFAATMSALLGVPFPFGSIGRVNPLLYSLAAGGSILEHTARKGDRNYSYQEWMRHYVSVLCMNVWQVKRYIDVYSASSVIGFPSEDLLHVEDIYSQAQQNWLHIMNKSLSCKGVSCGVSLPELEGQVEAYLKFLGSVIELARSKWTEFNLKLMVVGLSILFMSLFVQLAAIKRTNKFIRSSLTTGHLQASVRFALFVVVMRACSFLSNSYILEEGKVAIFFLGTTAILGVRQSIITKRTLSEATLLLLLVCAFRFTMEFGLSKQVTVLFDQAGIFGIAQDHPFWIYLSSIMTMLVMFSLAYILHKFSSDKTGRGVQKYVILGTVFCYILIATYYGLEGELFSLPLGFQNVTRKYIPWSIYAIGILQLVSLALGEVFHAEKSGHYQKGLTLKMVAMVCTWSSTIILLLGKQGAMVALATIGAAWCIVRLGNLEQAVKKGRSSYLTLYPLPITQWSLLAVALFFCTGHWCAFDGLRYGAAFVGFDEFVLVRQAILLTIDTFGFSHILPVFGLPILVSQCFPSNNMQHSKLFTSVQLSQVYLMYGFVTAIGVAFTVLCVTIHRRHLMVWGLFAPKYVFDVVGLILTDVLICVASVYYIDPVEDDNTVMRN